jgi:hypothetical protein
MLDSAANEYMSLVEKNGRLLQPQRIVLRLRLLRNEGGDDRTAGPLAIPVTRLEIFALLDTVESLSF